MRAVKILSWRNDFIRTGLIVKIDPTDEQIIEAVSHTLGDGMDGRKYKGMLIEDLNYDNKNYNPHMNNKVFVEVLEKEKLIEIIDPYVPPSEPDRPTSNNSNILPSMKKFWIQPETNFGEQPKK